MTVYRKQGRETWSYDFKLQGRRYAGSFGVKSKRAAEAAEQRIREQIANGEFGGVASMTIDEAAERYWQEKGQHQGDARNVEHRLAIVVRLLGPTTTLAEINQGAVAQAIERRSRETYQRAPDKVVKGRVVKAKRYPVSPSTVNRDIITPLQSLLRRARSHWNRLPRHGLPDISWRDLKLAEPRGLSRTYPEADRENWLAEAAAWGADLDLALDMLLTYGLRLGELRFPLDAVNPYPAAPTLTLQKGRKRDVLLHLPLRQDHARRLAARISVARAHKLNTVWFEPAGKKLVALTLHQLSGRLNAAADAAGISGGRRIHGARHHAGSAMLSKTGNLKLVQSLLGHASIMSSARYAHVQIDELRGALGEQSHHSPTGAPADKAANDG